MSGYSQALRRLWTGTCNVYVKGEDKINETNGRNESGDELLYEALPCRISFGSIPSTKEDGGAAEITQTIKLFIDSSVNIPPGSRLDITQNGVTESYERSGAAAVYSTHQEINLERVKGWA